MKSLLSLTALLLSSVLSYAFEVDGIAYNITSEDDLTVEVARKSYYSGIIVIPERVTYEGNDYTVTSISDIAFYECSLTSLTIPSSVTSIGKMAFYKCGLTSLTIPSSVTSIGDRAFGGCGGLTSVTIPSSVTSISKGVFQGCGGLTSLTIPSGVTSIGDEAFQGCSGLTSLTIPSSVTSIGLYAFSGCSGLTSLTIPDGVTSIGHAAFYRCSRLTSVTIPSSVTSIGDEAFSNCLSLTSVKIPSRVTSIGERVFEGCSGLTSLTIPSSVTSIGVRVFENCRGLTSIVVEDGNTVYDSRDNCNAIVRTSDNTLIAGCKNTVIPSSVMAIGECTFASCRGLTSVTIPKGVTSIGGSAFSSCSGLTSVIVGWEIPLEIDGSIFEYSNYNNATLYVPKGTKAAYEAASVWKDFGEVREIFDKSDGALSDSQGIRYTANDDESTCYVSGHDDNYVTGIVIPNIFNGRYVTSIGAGAFSGCSNLTSLTVERNTPIAVDGSAFEGSNYRDITLRVPIGSKAAYDAAEGWNDFGEIMEWFDGADGEVVDAQGVKYTANDDESTCYVSGHESNYSAEIVIPEVYGGRRVTSIGDHAFQDCSGLTSVTISEGVTSIDDYAFSGCSGLTSVTIPEGVRRIRYCTFQGCSRLTSVTIPSSVSWFGGYAFSGCSGLTSVTISEGVTSIGAWNFENCSSLTSVTIPSSVGGIGIGAFSGCSSLTSVTISEGVTSIGVSAFQSCSSLTSIVVEEGNTVYDSRDNCNAIIRTDDNTLIAGCKNTFIPSSVTSIGVNAFSGSGLTSVTIPSSVTSIGGGAFYGCI